MVEDLRTGAGEFQSTWVAPKASLRNRLDEIEDGLAGSMPVVEIRLATENDVAFLAGVLEAVDELRDQQDDLGAYRAGWQAYVRGQIRDPEPGSRLCVVESASEPAGRLRVVHSDERVFLAGLQIHPVYQGKGIGTAVIGALLNEARAQGLPLQLDVHKDNLGAQRLYRRLGFREYGRSDHDLLMTLS